MFVDIQIQESIAVAPMEQHRLIVIQDADLADVGGGSPDMGGTCHF